MYGLMAYSETECLEALIQAADQLGQTPTKEEYDSLGISPTAQTIVDHCGTWRLALSKADLDLEPRREYSKKNCINALRNATDILDEEPSLNSYSDLGLNPSASTITEIFDSWNAAKEAAGVRDFGKKSPKEEAEEFFERLEKAKPVNKRNRE